VRRPAGSLVTACLNASRASLSWGMQLGGLAVLSLAAGWGCCCAFSVAMNKKQQSNDTSMAARRCMVATIDNTRREWQDISVLEPECYYYSRWMQRILQMGQLTVD